MALDRLIAGTPLEPRVPNGNNLLDWAISSQALITEKVQRLSRMGVESSDSKRRSSEKRRYSLNSVERHCCLYYNYTMNKQNGEIWKAIDEIPGYEDIVDIHISNLGRIKSFKQSNKGHILKTSIRMGHGPGYEVISLSGKSGKRYKFSIHRLVCLAFNFVENHRELTVDHIDENTLNNVSSNLQWLTVADNIRKSQKHSRTFTEEEIKVICDRYAGESIRLQDLADEYNCSLWTIWNTVNNYSLHINEKKRKVFSLEKRNEIAKFKLAGNTLKETGSKFNCSQSLVSFIVGQYERGELNELA